MKGGDFNCPGLYWSANKQEWVASSPDSHAFLRLVRDTGLKIINKRVPGTFTRYQDGARSTLDLLLANPKLFVLTTSYKVDSDCQYNVSSDHRLVMAHTTLQVLTPPGVNTGPGGEHPPN
jgi:hypothetical protein